MEYDDAPYTHYFFVSVNFAKVIFTNFNIKSIFLIVSNFHLLGYENWVRFSKNDGFKL